MINLGLLKHSFEGTCLFYAPDKDKPTMISSEDVNGQIIYECLNLRKDLEKKAENRCGENYCLIRKEKNEKTFSKSNEGIGFCLSGQK